MEENKAFNIWKWLVVLLVGCNMALIAIVWFKPQKMMHPPPPPGGHRGRIDFNEELSFTKEQNEAFTNMSKMHRHKIDSLKMLARDVRAQFFVGIGTEKNAARLDSLAGVLGNYQKLVELQTYAHFSQVREMLGDKQKEIFDHLVQDVLKNLPEQPRLTGGHGPESRGDGGPPPEHDGPPPPDGRDGPPPPDAH